MTRNKWTSFLTVGMALGLFVLLSGSEAPPPRASDKTGGSDQKSLPAEGRLPSVEEARGQARLLHDALHATLQIVHHQYFREGQGLPLPARTLKVVFADLERRRQVQLRWLVVNAEAMNVDHKPRTEFEKEAANAIAAGKTEVERVEDGVYRHAGTITLAGECLTCHLPSRTGTKDRAAGLVISMRVKPD